MSGQDDCTLDTCPIEDSVYEYRPSISANGTLLALFAVAGLIHLVQLILWRRRVFSIPILIGCVGEILGYVGRIMLYKNPFSENGFLIQICCLTIAPAFYSAAIYFCISDIVRFFGVEASRLQPTHYAYIFIPCDLISLILQGTGGGLASVASQDDEDDTTGTNVMVAGLAFQVFTLLTFIILTLEFAWRVRQHRLKHSGADNGDKRALMTRNRLAIFGIPFSLAILCLFIRCLYRIVELSGGWDSEFIRDQASFIALEGVMVIITVFALNASHPKLLDR